MIDGERYHLNTLLALSKQGLNQSWGDFEQLVGILLTTANNIELYDIVEANYIRQDILLHICTKEG